MRDFATPVKKSQSAHKSKKAVTSAEELPVKPALEELAFVRKAFQDAAAHFVARIEGDLNGVREAISIIATRKRAPSERVKDLRDVLLILREIELKPEKGRRRDLKKVESAVKDLRQIIDGWD